MAERLEPIGVEAIAKGVGSFLNSMKQMEAAFDRTSKKLDGFAPATAQATGGTQKLGGAISGLLPSLSGVSGGLGGVVGALGPLALGVGAAVGGLYVFKKGFDTLIGTIQAATAAVTGFMAEGMQLAGRFQEMEIAALAVGRTMGLQEQEIRGAIETYKDLGIRTDVAAKAAASFAKNQIDLTRASELVRIAQGAAILTGEDSSATMERLTWAVTTQNTRMMRYMGIMVDFQAAQKRWAEANDRTTDSLTQVEKNMIALNEAIRAGASVADIYGEAMKSPTKAMRSLTSREIPELKAAIGAPFLQAWATVVNAIRDFVKALTGAAQEGGALYPVLVKLGAIASILADAFASALGVVTGFISDLQTDLFGGMEETASGMLRWGAEIVASLAEGIVNAASTVLVMAMNAISGILTFWLGAASAPRVAPDLVKWGAAAMGEYLHGMTMADFGVLEKIQGPLKQVLSGPEFASISADMIKALSEGTTGEPLFEKIAQAAGAFGTEIAELARLQFQLADATRAVEDAERRVSQGRQRVTDLTAEYNDLVRAGAAPEVLKAKLAELNAAEEGLELAKEQRKAAQGEIGDLEERAKLQEKVVGQLVGLAKAAVPPAAAAALAGAKAPKMPKAAKPEAVMPEIALPTPAQFDIKSRIGQAIDEAKAVMREKMADLFTPLTDAWENMKTGPLSEIGPAFAKMWGLVEETWDSFWSGFREGWGDMSGVFETFLTEVKPALAEAWRALGDLWSEIAEILGLDETNWGNLVAALGEFVGSSTAQFIRDFLDATVKGLEDFAEAVDWVVGRIGALRGAFDNLKTALEHFSLGEIMNLAAIDLGIFQPGSITPFEEGLWGVVGAMGAVASAAQEFLVFEHLRTTLEELVMVFLPLFVETIVIKFIELRDQVTRLVRELTDMVIQLFRRMRDLVVRAVREMCRLIIAALEALYEKLKEETLVKIAEIFEEMAERIVEAVRKIRAEIDRLNSALDDLIDKANKAKQAMQDAGLIGESPSKLEIDLRGAARAMRQLTAVEMPRLTASTERVGGPVPVYAPAAAAAGGGGETFNVTVGPNYVNGDTDMAAFEVKVEEAVRRVVYRRW